MSSFLGSQKKRIELTLMQTFVYGFQVIFDSNFAHNTFYENQIRVVGCPFLRLHIQICQQQKHISILVLMKFVPDKSDEIWWYDGGKAYLHTSTFWHQRQNELVLEKNLFLCHTAESTFFNNFTFLLLVIMQDLQSCWISYYIIIII